MDLIEVEGVSKSFRIPATRRETIREHFFDFFRPRPYRQLKVLDDVSFSVRRGEALGVMGRNGTGKSTLLRIISDIYRPDAGRVVVHAPITPILELGVGWNHELDAIDNIELLGTVLGMTLGEVRRATGEILAFAGLEDFASLELKHFSSGMAARLAYSVAFQAAREILVLDEIFAVGDAGFRWRCHERFRELHAAGHTLLLVSHNTDEVAEFCDRALLLDGGRKIFEGTGEDVAAAYEEQHRAEARV